MRTAVLAFMFSIAASSALSKDAPVLFEMPKDGWCYNDIERKKELRRVLSDIRIHGSPFVRANSDIYQEIEKNLHTSSSVFYFSLRSDLARRYGEEERSLILARFNFISVQKNLASAIAAAQNDERIERSKIFRAMEDYFGFFQAVIEVADKRSASAGFETDQLIAALQSDMWSLSELVRCWSGASARSLDNTRLKVQ